MPVYRRGKRGAAGTQSPEPWEKPLLRANGYGKEEVGRPCRVEMVRNLEPGQGRGHRGHSGDMAWIYTFRLGAQSGLTT